MKVETLILYTLMICVGFYILWIYKFHSNSNDVANNRFNFESNTVFKLQDHLHDLNDTLTAIKLSLIHI